MRISVVVPAHNEEALLPRGLEAIATASRNVAAPVEVVVVADRCTDATAEIAHAAGAHVVECELRNIGAVRNLGVAASTGDIVVTIDADSIMHADALRGVAHLLATGRYVGGGTQFVAERSSPGIRATYAAVVLMTTVTRLGGAMFWCDRADFEAVEGFDEALLIAEDLDFARRLRAHGRKSGRRFTVLRDTPMVASTRKFDRFGDWHMFRWATQARQIRAVLAGTDTAWADRYFFDFNDSQPVESAIPRR